MDPLKREFNTTMTLSYIKNVLFKKRIQLERVVFMSYPKIHGIMINVICMPIWCLSINPEINVLVNIQIKVHFLGL